MLKNQNKPPLTSINIITCYNDKSKGKTIKCWIDEKSFKRKPNQKEFFEMMSRFHNSKKQNHTFKEIIKAVAEGRSVIPANLKTDENNNYIARKNKYFINTNLLFLDFDKGITIPEALEIAKQADLEPSAVYKTFSHTKNKHKFRFVYYFENALNKKEFKLTFKRMNNLFNNKVDPQTKDPSRLFYGTNQEQPIVKFEPSNIYNLDNIKKLPEAQNSPETRVNKQIDELDSQKITTLEQRFLQLDRVQNFINGKWEAAGGYEWVRSMYFIFEKLNKLDYFFKVMKAKYPSWVGNWNYYHSHDKENHNQGHSKTNKLLAKIGYFNYSTDNLNMYQGKNIKIKNKYITENQIKAIFDSIATGDKTLITAPTGSGKTTSFLRYVKKYNKKIIFLLPYVSTTKQVNNEHMQQGKIVSFYGSKKVDLTGNEQVIIATYDKAAQIRKLVDKNDYTLVLDEGHNIVSQYNFRRQAMISVKKLEQLARSVIHITATPVGLKSDYDNIYNFTKKRSFKKVNVVDRKHKAELMSLIVNNSKSRCLDIVRINNKREQQQIKDSLINANHYSKDEILILNSDLKDEKEFINLINNEKIASNYRLLLTTSLIDDGVNIKNKNINNIYFYGSLDINALLQFPSRCRAGFNEMFIFKKLNNEKQSFNLNDRFNYLYNKAEKEAGKLNAVITAAEKEGLKAKPEQLLKGFSGLLVPDFIRFDNNRNKYVVDEFKILCKIYQQLSGALANRDFIKNILEKYVRFEEVNFITDDIEILGIEEAEKVDYTQQLHDILNDKDITLNCFANYAGNYLKIGTRNDLPSYLVINQEKLKEKYPELNKILKTEKSKVNKFMRLYILIHSTGKTETDSLAMAKELYFKKVKFKTFKHKLQSAIAFDDPSLLRKAERNILLELKSELEGKELTKPQLKNKVEKILNKDIGYIKPFIEKFFNIEINRKRVNGKLKRFVKIINAAELSNIYGISFENISDGFKVVGLKNYLKAS